jgi:hypothetical protein
MSGGSSISNSIVGGGERQTPWTVRILSWNPTIDLLAIVSTNDDIAVERLFWKKAWQVVVGDN